MLKLRRIYSGILVISGMLTSFAALGQVNAEQVLTIGRNVLSMEDYMLSIQYFNQAIKAKPYLSDPYFFRGLAKLYLEDYKGAEADCTEAISRNKFKTESYKVRGFARQNLGKDSLAVEDYKVGLNYNPEDKYFLYYKAVAEIELKRYTDADTTLGFLLRLNPKFDDGYTARGRLRAQQGDTVRALEDIAKAIKVSPGSLNPYLLRAEIESQQKDWESANNDMTEAIRLRPLEADFYVNRAYLRYNLDDYFGAMSDYNYALELEPYNTAALFNRALLRYEVKDLEKSAQDLESVLRLEPENFHAQYNLGLIDLERGRNKEALSRFQKIVKKYPKFHPAYYAIGEAYRNMGNMKSALKNAYYAEDLVKKYVKNPEKNQLDRPTIASGKTNTKGLKSAEEESDTEVMDRFNQLVTVQTTTNQEISYNEKIKGRVQDRDMQIEPEPAYCISFFDSSTALKNMSNYFRELDDFNNHNYISGKLYLSAGDMMLSDEEKIGEIFGKANYYNNVVSDGAARPADYLALGVAQTMLKNYDAAILALDKAIENNPDFTVAYMARAYARNMQMNVEEKNQEEEETKEDMLHMRKLQKQVSEVLSDYDKALSLNSNLVFAWFNKGNLYYAMRDYTSAMQCYTEALNLDSSFGPAYYNRGITYLQVGNKRQSFLDLSQAGELGVLPSYNLLKRMK